MRLLGGKNSVSFVMWQAASFSNSGNKISSRAQNERWIGTGRRSIYHCQSIFCFCIVLLYFISFSFHVINLRRDTLQQ